MHKKIKNIVITSLLITICFSSNTNSRKFSNSGMIKSLILPGWSHLNLKDSKRHNVFFVAESILWLGLSRSIMW